MKSRKQKNRFNLGHLGNMNYLGNTICGVSASMAGRCKPTKTLEKPAMMNKSMTEGFGNKLLITNKHVQTDNAVSLRTNNFRRSMLSANAPPYIPAIIKGTNWTTPSNPT